MKTNNVRIKQLGLLSRLSILPLLLFACGGGNDRTPSADAAIPVVNAEKPIDDALMPVDDSTPPAEEEEKPAVSGNASGQDILPTGDTQFVSADGVQTQRSNSITQGDFYGATGIDDMNASADSTGKRTVEEGDIYKVLNGNKILNLNSYRGLQVIDFVDVAKPNVMGRLAVTGTPVELYVVDNKAIILLNHWIGYYASREDVKLAKQEGGLVALVDLSDLAQPKLLDQAYVRGTITTSRLTRAGAQIALYVAANAIDASRTVVKSFKVSENAVAPVTELDLGGSVQAIQATTEALLVAHNDYNGSEYRSRVTVVDITDPTGKMVQGGDVTVAGMVQTKFNLDLYKGVLRIASGSTWNSSTTNHVQTYDAKDFSKLTEIGHCSFSDGQQLFATLFLGNKAFFVTYLRRDPFHAFWIGDDGKCQEQNQFIVSGWNDFFRAVLGETRLIGIGKNDEGNSRTMAVSLYDITDLSNPNPLLARAEAALDNSWSQASWDDKAFSVLENAVSAEAAGGETGLVLLPFEGYSQKDQRHIAAVQVYTFSDKTLTRRGVMDHGTSVQRSFLANDQTCANLSNAELSFFNDTDPNSPKELGRLELAPNYTQLLIFGNHAVRLKNTSEYYSWWGSNAILPNSIAEVISLSTNPDSAIAIQQIEVPSNAYLVKSGNYLVSVNMVFAANKETSEGYVNTYNTTIDVYDMSDPRSPTKFGTITTDKLQSSYNYDYYYGYPIQPDVFSNDKVGFIGDYFVGYAPPNIQVIDGAVVFAQTKRQQTLLGKETACYKNGPSYRTYSESCSSNGNCTSSYYYFGTITCKSLNGEAQVCTGEITKCAPDAPVRCCEPVDPGTVPLTETCYTNDRYRYWTSYSFYVLDLTGSIPRLTEPIELPTKYEGTYVLARSASIYYSYAIPYEVKDDQRDHVQYYYIEIDLRTPSKPIIGEPVNVPGVLLAVQGDIVYTRDTLWGGSAAQSVVNKLKLRDGLAYRQASHVFTNQTVRSVALDQWGHVLADRQLTRNASSDCSATANNQYNGTALTILSASDLTTMSEVQVDDWAILTGAKEGRALFQVSGGLLIMNVKDPQVPYAQAYFPAPTWLNDVLFDGNSILIPAGRYGIHRFDASAFNLLPASQLTP